MGNSRDTKEASMADGPRRADFPAARTIFTVTVAAYRVSQVAITCQKAIELSPQQVTPGPTWIVTRKALFFRSQRPLRLIYRAWHAIPTHRQGKQEADGSR